MTTFAIRVVLSAEEGARAVAPILFTYWSGDAAPTFEIRFLAS
ncbi:hypothetical protein [Deinococcus irradiatisoli]|nr:hypothetical protein [Deinococcus irradiatisoli]